MNNKIAGLYLNLAKALNALQEAGEEPMTMPLGVEGDTGSVVLDPETDRFTVVQA